MKKLYKLFIALAIFGLNAGANAQVVGSNCIDYTNLAAAQPQYGTWYLTTSTWHPTSITINNGHIDYGYANWLSRHTVHTVLEYDTITLGGLRTITEGASASVRLGNKGNNSEWEGLTYIFTVDSVYSLLLFKYATVFEAPGHGVDYDPKITLEILSASGHIIGSNCGNIFLSSYQSVLDYGYDPTWHFIPQSANIMVPNGNTASASMRPAQNIYWKDWTTIGVSLRYPIDLRGQTVRVRIRNFDCAPGEHFGYSYFTLDFAKSELEGRVCGDTPVDTLKAPEGFKYCWYKGFNPDGTLVLPPFNCVSTERIFTPPSNDTATYMCQLTQIGTVGNPHCAFHLISRLKEPRSAASFRQIPTNCQNVIQLINDSFGNYGQYEMPETNYWLVTQQNGMVIDTILTSNAAYPPPFIAPNEGATYNLRLVTGVINNQCTDTLNVVMTVPPYNLVLETIHATICQGEVYNLNGFNESETGTYIDTLQNICGFDSIVTLNLVVNQSSETTIYDTVCENYLPYRANGFNVYTTGTHTLTLQNINGCDSIVILELTVNPTSETIIYDTICIGENYTLNGFNVNTTGIYTIILPNIYYCDSTVTLNLTVEECFNWICEASISLANIYSTNNRSIIIENFIGDISIYNVQGQIIASKCSQNGTIEISVPQAGVYLVKIENSFGKVVVNQSN